MYTKIKFEYVFDFRCIYFQPQTSFTILFTGILVAMCMLFVAGPAPFLPFLPSDSLLSLLIAFVVLGVALSCCVVTFSLIVATAK